MEQDEAEEMLAVEAEAQEAHQERREVARASWHMVTVGVSLLETRYQEVCTTNTLSVCSTSLLCTM